MLKRRPASTTLFPYTTLFRSLITATVRALDVDLALLETDPSSRALADLQALRDHAAGFDRTARRGRSEEHTSELQTRGQLVCRLLLERIKNITDNNKAHHSNA